MAEMTGSKSGALGSKWAEPLDYRTNISEKLKAQMSDEDRRILSWGTRNASRKGRLSRYLAPYRSLHSLTAITY